MIKDFIMKKLTIIFSFLVLVSSALSLPNLRIYECDETSEELSLFLLDRDNNETYEYYIVKVGNKFHHVNTLKTEINTNLDVLASYDNLCIEKLDDEFIQEGDITGFSVIDANSGTPIFSMSLNQDEELVLKNNPNTSVLTDNIENEIEVYPNPADDYVYLKFNCGCKEFSSIIISDMMGNEVKKIQKGTIPDDGIYELQTADMGSGKYLIKVLRDFRAEKTVKLVVAH